MRIAVIDLGTNTCRLLLAQVERAAIVRMDVRETHVVRLGEGVDANRRLLPEAAARTRRRLDDYSRRVAGYQPDASLLLATSVLRDAEDGQAFLADVSADTGLPARLIGGHTEARLTFRGATSRLELPPGPVAVVDIGGGSTELAIGRVRGGEARGAHRRAVSYAAADRAAVASVDIGALRLTERFFADDPPTRSQWQAAVSACDEGLRALPELLQAAVPVASRSALPEAVKSAPALVGVAGTFTTLAAHLLGLREYDPWAVHGSRLSLEQLRSTIARFRRLTSAQRARLPGIQKGREDVILAGALLAERICVALGAVEVTVSEADLLDGAALWLADGLPSLS